MDEPCGCGEVREQGSCQDTTSIVLEQNPQRVYALRDLWAENLNELVDQQIAPEPQKREMLFLALSNAMLDMVMDIMPEELVEILAENLDDYIRNPSQQEVLDRHAPVLPRGICEGDGQAVR